MRPRSRAVAKCSSATEISPLSHRVPISCSTGSSTRLATASTVKRAIASSRIALASASSKRSSATASRSAWSVASSLGWRSARASVAASRAASAAETPESIRAFIALTRSSSLVP